MTPETSNPCRESTLRAHHHLSHSTTIHATPRLLPGSRNVSYSLLTPDNTQAPNSYFAGQSRTMLSTIAS